MAPAAKPLPQAHQRPPAPVAAQQKTIKIQPKAAVKTVQMVKKQPAPAPKAQPALPRTVAVKKVAAPQQLQQVKAPAKTTATKPAPKQAAPKTHSLKPQLKTKMQQLLSQHSKPAPKTAVKTVQLAKKGAPTKVVAKAPAAPVAKTAQLVRKAPVRPAVVAKKPLPKKTVGLAQVKTASDQTEGNLLNSFDQGSMQNLLATKDKLHHLYQAIGEPKEKQVENLAKSYGIEMDDEMKEAKAIGSNQMIAHAIADRVLLQLNNGKP